MEERKMFVARGELQDVDMVNSPQHYNVNGLECIDAMLKLYGKDAVLNFCMLNSFKYQWRCNNKGNCKQDLQKSRWYLNKYLELLEQDEQSII